MVWFEGQPVLPCKDGGILKITDGSADMAVLGKLEAKQESLENFFRFG